MRQVVTFTIVSIFAIAFSGSLFATSPVDTPAGQTLAMKKKRDKKPAGERSEETKATETKDEGPASQLTKGSVWRGDRWRGQAGSIEGPQDSNIVKVTMRDGNRVTLSAKKWAGGQGGVNWTFEINGKQLTCKAISFEGGGGTATFDQIQGGGIIEGEVLQFEVSARQKSPRFNGPIHEKLVLKKSG